MEGKINSQIQQTTQRIKIERSLHLEKKWRELLSFQGSSFNK